MNLRPQPEAKDLGMAMNDYLLGRLQLAEGDALYESTRVSLRRRQDGRPVDVYEMYWADLSRLGEGGLRALTSLYQLFFHINTLGAGIVDQVSLSVGRRYPLAPAPALSCLDGLADEGADGAAAAVHADAGAVRRDAAWPPRPKRRASCWPPCSVSAASCWRRSA